MSAVATADEARRLLAGFGPLAVEVIELDAADGRVVAVDLHAPEPLPSRARAMMDGYAVRSEDGAGPRRWIGSIAIGLLPSLRVERGTAAAIPTGGLLPDGADAVVMLEETRRSNDDVELVRAVAPQANVMPAGGDLGQGDVIVPRGRRIGARELTVLAALGFVHVPVRRRPRVALLATGDELVAANGPRADGQVRDATSLPLAAWVRRAGGIVNAGGIAPDERAVLERRGRALLADCDCLLFTGGSSVGAADLTSRVLADIGVEILCHGIAVRPGRPTIIGRYGDVPVLGLPGVPTAAQTIFQVFVRPLLERLSGAEVRPARIVSLAAPIESVTGREDYARVRLRFDGCAEPIWGGRSTLSGWLATDGLVVVPTALARLATGAAVELLEIA